MLRRIVTYDAWLKSSRLALSAGIPASSRTLIIWQENKDNDYGKKDDRSNLDTVKAGLKIIRNDLTLFKQEMQEKMSCDGFYFPLHGDYEYFCKFHDQETINSWVAVADSDHGEGKSHANFTLNKNKKGLFHGYLTQEVPKDGVIKKAGYCAVRSPPNRKAFNRSEPYDWSRYSHLFLKVRGDGRNYLMTLTMDHYFDVLWNDQFHFPLFTRGGPHWQLVQIPFSKFYLTAKGRIQDKQEPMNQEKVATLGISVADGVEGPFQLEIDYIGLLFDAGHTEETAYEMYKVDPSHVGS